MQYENNLRKKVFYKKKKNGFQKAFFQKVHLEKGGVVLYLGQYCILFYSYCSLVEHSQILTFFCRN